MGTTIHDLTESTIEKASNSFSDTPFGMLEYILSIAVIIFIGLLLRELFGKKNNVFKAKNGVSLIVIDEKLKNYEERLKNVEKKIDVNNKEFCSIINSLSNEFKQMELRIVEKLAILQTLIRK